MMNIKTHIDIKKIMRIVERMNDEHAKNYGYDGTNEHDENERLINMTKLMKMTKMRN